VSDIAHAHTLALDYMAEGKNKTSCEVFNLGTGNGVTVLEAIHAFEKVNAVKLNYSIGPRRPGDIMAIYASNELAKKELGWEPKHNLEDMVGTAWKWEQRLKADEKVFSGKPGELN
jgi:UDP-glucose 4-epimerase